MITPVEPEFNYAAETTRLVAVLRILSQVDLSGIVKHAPLLAQLPECPICREQVPKFRKYEAELAGLLLPVQIRAREILADSQALIHQHAAASVTL